MKPILTLMLAFVMLPMAVLGVEGVDFLSDGVSLEDAPGNTVSSTVDINNTGDEAINVTFSGYTLTSGSNTLELTAIADEQDMDPEDTRTITVEAIIPADQVAGTYNGNLIAETEEGATDSLPVEVNVTATSDGLVLDTAPADGETLPGVTVDVDFAVENQRNAPITAIMNGTLTSGSEELAVTETTVQFAEFETKDVTATVVVASSQPAGTYNGIIELHYDDTQLDVAYELVVNESESFTATSPSLNLRPGEDANASITLTNTGNLDVTGINATYVEATLYDNDGDRVVLTFYPESTDLTDTTAVVVVEADVSSRMNAGDYTSTITFESDNGVTATATYNLEIESILEISDVTLDSEGEDEEVKPGEELTIEVEIENTDEDIDLEDVLVTVRFRDGSRYLEDDDGDDIEEEADEFDLDADDKDTVFITVQMPFEDIDDGDEYVVEITVEAQNADDSRQVFTDVNEEETIEFVKEDHEIDFTEAVISPGTIRCSRRTAVDLGVQNIGRKDEDVQIIIKNEELDVYILRAFDLDKDPDDTDNEWDETFYIDIDEDQDEGSYPILVEAFFDDGDESLRETLTLNVEECVSTSNGRDDDDDRQEQGEIDIIPTTPPTQPPTVPGSTTVESKDEGSSTKAYVALLIVLVLALIVLVAYLGSYAYRNY